MSEHLIERCVLEIYCPEGGQARAAAGMDSWAQHLLPALEEALAELPDDATIEFDRLELDLGQLEWSPTGAGLALRLGEALRTSLEGATGADATRGVVGGAPAPSSESGRALEVLACWLETGILPWWWGDRDPPDLKASLETVWEGERPELATWLRCCAAPGRVIERAAGQLGHDWAARLAHLWKDASSGSSFPAISQGGLIDELGEATAPMTGSNGGAGVTVGESNREPGCLRPFGSDWPAGGRGPSLSQGEAHLEIAEGRTGSAEDPGGRGQVLDRVGASPEAAADELTRRGDLDAEMPRSLSPMDMGDPMVGQDGAELSAGTDLRARDRGPNSLGDASSAIGAQHGLASSQNVVSFPEQADGDRREQLLVGGPPGRSSVRRGSGVPTPPHAGARPKGADLALRPPVDPLGSDVEAQGRADGSGGPRPAQAPDRDAAADEPASLATGGSASGGQVPAPPGAHLVHLDPSGRDQALPYSWESPGAAPRLLPTQSAGLVLLQPFLPRLFEATGAWNGRDWASDQEQIESIFLLHALAHPHDGEVGERHLCLEKLMVGLRPEDPVPARWVLAPSALAEGEELLRAVLAHWTALKSSDPQGLREAFLARPGLLEARGPDWRLGVTRQPWDILLSKLPWSLGIMRLPWSRCLLDVEWPP